MPRPRGYDKQFGHHALRNLREWQDITPGELADRVVASGGRLSAQTVRNIESGTTRPSLALLDELLAALHSDPERLEQVRIQLIEADEETKAQATAHLATRRPAGGDAAPASSSLPQAVQAGHAPGSSTWSSPVNPSVPAQHSAAAPPAGPPAPLRVGSSDRPSLPAPRAPEPWEALRELGDIYSQLDATGRHALIGRARQLLATQRAADFDVTRRR